MDAREQARRPAVMQRTHDRFVWDTTATLESLGAAGVVLWMWDPERDRMRLTGAVRALGLGPLAPECSSAALLALVAPHDRNLLESLLRRQTPGVDVAARAQMRGSESCLWRGVWLEEGSRAAGVVAPERRFAVERRDGLTGLLERRAFIARAAERLTEPVPYVLMVADLDRLRRLNEALGHERADMVLAALGSRLVAAFPANTLLARIGEDEFAILTPEGGEAPADTVRTALEQPLRVAGFDIYPTLSIGQVKAEGGEQAPDAGELLRRAELNLEVAKGSRRNWPTVGPVKTADTDGLSRLALEADLRGALGRGEIVPYYQPVVRLCTGAISGFEA